MMNKASAIKTLLIALIALFAPAKPMLLATLAMVFLDLFTGLLAARKRGEQITSGGLKRTIVKMFVYEIALLIAYIVSRYMEMPFMPIDKIVSSFIGITEMKSVFENVDEISGGDLLKNLINKLSNYE